MFSGGLDSTFSLYHLLKNTNANIYVHHIAFEDSSSKEANEDIACNNLITHFKKIRDFKYSKSKYRSIGGEQLVRLHAIGCHREAHPIHAIVKAIEPDTKHISVATAIPLNQLV